MTEYDATLARIAGEFGVEPVLLERYLFEDLDPATRTALFDPRLAKLEALLTYNSTGVYTSLIERTDQPGPRRTTITDYVSNLLEGVYRASAEQGYAVSHRMTNLALATPDYFRAMFTKHPEAGALLLIPQSADVLARTSAEMGRSCLIFDYVPPETLPVHVLNVDGRGAVRELTHELIRLGHRRIAYITGLMRFRSAVERLEGYRMALEEAGLPVDPALIANGNWEMALGHQCAAAFLNLANPPTAIMCANDLSALGAYEAIREAGLTIPDDVSVTGFDDIPIVSGIQPPLTTVRQGIQVMGYNAARLLIQAMNGGLVGDYRHTQPLELIFRDSTGKPRAS